MLYGLSAIFQILRMPFSLKKVSLFGLRLFGVANEKYSQANRCAKGVLTTGDIIKERGVMLISCQKALEKRLP